MYFGVPKGIRTPVTAVKGRCPGPLDDGDESAQLSGREDYTPGRGGTTVPENQELAAGDARGELDSPLRTYTSPVTFQNAPGRSYVPAS